MEKFSPDQKQTKESGIEARKKLLAQKLEDGEINQEDLELAAFLGDPAAMTLEPDEYEEISNTIDLEGWTESLMAHYGEDTGIRAAIAATRYVLPFYERWSEEQTGKVDPRLSQALDAAELSLMGKEVEIDSEKISSNIVEAAEETEPFVQNQESDEVEATKAAKAGFAATAVESVFLATQDESVFNNVKGAIEMAFYAHFAKVDQENFEPDEEATMQDILGAVQKEVASWALGEGDPVADRVRAREGSDEEQ